MRKIILNLAVTLDGYIEGRMVKWIGAKWTGIQVQRLFLINFFPVLILFSMVGLVMICGDNTNRLKTHQCQRKKYGKLFIVKANMFFQKIKKKPATQLILARALLKG